MKIASYMPQQRGADDGRWWNMWFAPVGYARAAEIRAAAIAAGLDESRARIIFVASTKQATR